MVGCSQGREQIPTINAKARTDVIHNQRVIPCRDLTSRENYHVPV